jgi:hypothetical protein
MSAPGLTRIRLKVRYWPQKRPGLGGMSAPGLTCISLMALLTGTKSGPAWGDDCPKLDLHISCNCMTGTKEGWPGGPQCPRLDPYNKRGITPITPEVSRRTGTKLIGQTSGGQNCPGVDLLFSPFSTPRLLAGSANTAARRINSSACGQEHCLKAFHGDYIQSPLCSPSPSLSSPLVWSNDRRGVQDSFSHNPLRICIACSLLRAFLAVGRLRTSMLMHSLTRVRKSVGRSHNSRNLFCSSSAAFCMTRTTNSALRNTSTDGAASYD